MRELRARVMWASAATTAVLAGVAYGLMGVDAGVGVAAAGALTGVNFWWLVHNAAVAAGPGPASRRVVWAITAGLRFLAVMGALVVLLASGLAHPVAVVAGLAIVPITVIVLGLRAAGRAEAA
jgi:hypothetical protein